jgi:hypothetical protein
MSRWFRAFVLVVLAPTSALAFETVDALVYPSRGAFPETYPPDPLYPTILWAQAGMMLDSNPFRLNDATDARAVLGDRHRSDAVMRYGVGAGHVARVVGRQGVRLLARGEYYDYLRYNTFDHFAYGLRGEWLWALGNDLSGVAGYVRENGLADPAEVQAPIKDEITTDRLFANGEYVLGPYTRLRAGVSEERGKREGDRGTLTTDGTTVFAGAGIATPLANAIGVEARRSEGAAPPGPLVDPTGQFAGNRYTEHEVALLAVYNLGTQLSVTGRLGRTRRDYSEVAVEEFDGTTGRGTISWRPGPKVAFTFDAYREPRGVLETDATHVDVRGARFGIAWAPTFKLVFTASFVNDHRRSQSSLDPTIPEREDTARSWRLAAGWEPRRHITLGTGLQYSERESSSVGRDFDYVQVMANLRYDW